MKELLQHLKTYLQLHHDQNDGGVYINLIARINEELATPDHEPVACARHRVHAYSSKVPTVSGGYKYVFFVAPDRPSNATLIFDAVENYIPPYTRPPAQQKPLSDDEVRTIINSTFRTDTGWIEDFMILVRSVEQAHGIGSKS